MRKTFITLSAISAIALMAIPASPRERQRVVVHPYPATLAPAATATGVAAGTVVGLGAHPVTITATDGSGNTATCATSFTVLDTTFRSDRRVEQELANRAGAMFVDTSTWLCARAGAQNVCPPVIDGVPVFRDDTHVGAEYQLELIPIVRALLVSAGVSVSGQAQWAGAVGSRRRG